MKTLSTWASRYLSHAPRERVSWNLVNSCTVFSLPGHAPRERVSWNFALQSRIPSYPSRSTWACELKCPWLLRCARCCQVTLHVSVWVEIAFINFTAHATYVTLHVSVWVEITRMVNVEDNKKVTLHVSVWVEIITNNRWQKVSKVTLHVSVWVEIFALFPKFVPHMSRSTWACELKF